MFKVELLTRDSELGSCCHSMRAEVGQKDKADGRFMPNILTYILLAGKVMLCYYAIWHLPDSFTEDQPQDLKNRTVHLFTSSSNGNLCKD